jgi:hypothetical protein
MKPIFTDEQLNIGKVLIIGGGHNLPVAEIKRITRATKVRKLKWTDNENDIDDFIISTLYETLYVLNENSLEGGDIYRVSGINSITTFLALKISKPYRAINLEAKYMKILHNSWLTKQTIDTTRQCMKEAVEAHNNLELLLSKLKIKNSLTTKTKPINKLLSNYADNEMDYLTTEVKKIMADTW